MQFAYDLVVIGFGKGGKTLATAAAKRGQKVALIEASKEMYGEYLYQHRVHPL